MSEEKRREMELEEVREEVRQLESVLEEEKEKSYKEKAIEQERNNQHVIDNSNDRMEVEKIEKMIEV